MITWQDLQAVGQDEKKRMEFVFSTIAAHESSTLYKVGKQAEEYWIGLNTHIMQLERVIYNAYGRAVQDIYHPNHKIPCGHYFYCLNQRNQHLLGNGISFGKSDTLEKLGKDFEHTVGTILERAENSSVAFGFWNVDHLEPLGVAKAESSNDVVFVPLWDETTGELMAGIKYWRVDRDRPLMATLFEPDGITGYMQEFGKSPVVTEPKRDYRQAVNTSEATGTTIRNAGNYGGRLPIFTLWNINRQSELPGSQGIIDAYDLMNSTLVNNVDNANLIYWVLKNCNAMDSEEELERFISRLNVTHVVAVDNETGGADVEARSVETPYEANKAALEQLRLDIFDKFMALDTREIAGGAVTATQIEAKYEALNAITDKLEWNVTSFICSILDFLGIDDKPTYTRSQIVNRLEMIQTIIAAGKDLPTKYKVKKILEILGDIDAYDEVIAMLEEEDAGRFALEQTEVE